MSDIPTRGSLRDVGISRILIGLNRRRLTGTLVVSAKSFSKKVYLKKGDAVFASSNYEDDRLGEVLLKAGKITVEQYDKSVEMLKKTGKRQGAILVELGYLSPKELFWGVKYQVREIIYSLFVLEDGDYEFMEGEIPPDEVITLKISMGNLIYEGVKRIDNWTRIKREMPAMNDVLALSSDPFSLFQNIELSSQDNKILALVNGERTIKDVIDSSWIGSFEALKILYVLYSTGLIVQSEDIVDKVNITVDDLLSDVSDGDGEIVKRIDELMKRIASGNYFEILECSEKADGAAIKKNYYRLVKEFHPDKHYDSDDNELRDKLTGIFDAITKAYTHLKDPKKADEYRMSLHQDGVESARKAAVEKSEKERAKDQFQTGVDEFKKGDFTGAVEKFRWAVNLDEKNAKYWNYYSLALSKFPKRIKEAEEALLYAIKLEPDNSDYLVNLGLLYLKAGLPMRAKIQFGKALTLDPGNEKAKKGMSELSAERK